MAKTNARKKKTLTLTQALASFLSRVLLPDLKERAEQGGVKAALQRQHAAEVEGKRTADGFLEWQARTLEQVGAAWVLSCVFVRTLEDRGLLGQRRLAGPGAGDSEQLFFELAPSLTARDYLLEVFREVGSLPGAEELFGARHNPVWRLSPSNEAARKLLEFFREPGEAGEGLAWEFAGGDTRFLGDLYQDLSEEVRKRYALLQTPDFVERFILDQTLEPAIAEFGLKEVRVIDPTCGSGHFLLGAFDRLVDHRLRVEPGIDVRTHAAAALEQVYGVDVNPYAVAIARFRLTLAYLEKAGITKLAQAPKLPLNLVVADSLLHGGKGREMLLVEQDSGQIDHAAWGTEMFALDDPLGARKVFRQRYHAVVGNPPYITCKDSALREVYRAAYRSAAGKYALAAPFTERFFELASDGGFVGLINANSFMKREFGKQLIEEVLPRLDLTRVIDTSGAYIPGHGTPTVLLFGRNQKPSSSSVNAVLGKRGEPSTPEDAEQGFVWRSIAEHGAEVGFENEYVSVAAVGRETLNAHPWSLGGGGAAELKELLEDRTATTLGDIAGSIGIASFTLEDDAFLATADVFRRNRVPEEHTREMMIGESIRDWGVGECPVAFFPYDSDLRPIKDEELALRYLWPYRTNLANNKLFGGKTKVEGGLRWYEYGRLTTDKLRTPLSIAFAEVATHNHFVLDRGGKVFKQTAPIIKLPESATEDDHLALLAYLNSSTACFWMKQVCYPKGGDHMGDGGRLSATKWQDRYALASNAIKPLPVPDLSGFAPFGAKMLALVEERNALLSALAVAAPAADWGDLVARAEEDDRRLLEKMVVLQEQLDWYTYRAFGLSEAVDDVPAWVVSPGQRPFECLVWERISEGDPDAQWFARSGYSRPPKDLPAATLRLVESIRSSTELSLIETMDYKRRWQAPDFSARVRTEIERAYLQASEGLLSASVRVWRVRDVAQAVGHTDRFRRWSEVHPALDADSMEEAERLLLAQSTPFTTAYLFNESGKEKYSAWLSTWHLQRQEDSGGQGPAETPPKFIGKDYRQMDYWALRGALNVPKEAFISYPGCEKDSDPTPLIGWAGWNHLQRAQAIISLYQERKTEDGWPAERLMPMLVGLHELMFWLELWHSKPESGSQNPSAEFKAFLDAELATHKLSISDLEAWRPPTRSAASKAGKSPRKRQATPEEPSYEG